MDFDGRELTRFYLEKQDLNLLLEVSGIVVNVGVDNVARDSRVCV